MPERWPGHRIATAGGRNRFAWEPGSFSLCWCCLRWRSWAGCGPSGRSGDCACAGDGEAGGSLGRCRSGGGATAGSAGCCVEAGTATISDARRRRTTAGSLRSARRQ